MIKRTLIGLLFLLMMAPAVAFSQEVQRRVVEEIRIEGNRRIEKEAVLAVIQTRVGIPYRRGRISDDVKSIFKMGYFEDVQVFYNDSSGILTFRLKEKTIIRKVILEGNDEFDDEEIEEELSVKSYSYVDQNKIRQDVEKIRNLYDEKGFFLADIQVEETELENNEVNLTFNITEGRRVVLRRITFIGNKIFSDDDLKKAIRTKEKGFFSFLTGSGKYQSEAFALDRRLLQDFYGRQGYIRVKVGNPLVQLSPDKKSLSLTVNIEEGEQYTVSKVDVAGELIKPKAELMEMLKLEEGKLANTRSLQEDIAKLTTVYADEGYAYANVIPRDEYDNTEKTVGISYFLQPGKKVYVERIDFVGNDVTRDKVLRREMRISEGELYGATKIRDSRQNIERLAVFEKVTVTTPRGSADDRVNIVVEVQEKSTGSFSIGAGFNTLESFQIIGTVQKRNLFGYGVDTSLQARVGARTQLFNFRYRDNYFLDTRLGLELNAFNIDRRFVDFDLTSRGGTLGLDYPLYQKGLQRIRAGVTYGFVDQSLSDIRPTVEQIFEEGITSSLTFFLSRDTRNRVFEPTKGSFLRLSEEIAGTFLGGDNTFSKLEFDGRWFFPVAPESKIPLFGGSVLAFHIGVGYVAPLKDGDRVPLFERYFPGGILSIRGFQLRSLGPEIQIASSNDAGSFTTTDFNIGGNKQLIFNAEYIMPLIPAANIKWVFFFDVGNAFDNGESLFTIAGQRQSTGFGIRWFSPIGPLRFEWGFPLDRTEDDGLVVFDFTIGTLF